MLVVGTPMFILTRICRERQSIQSESQNAYHSSCMFVLFDLYKEQSMFYLQGLNDGYKDGGGGHMSVIPP